MLNHPAFLREDAGDEEMGKSCLSFRANGGLGRIKGKSGQPLGRLSRVICGSQWQPQKVEIVRENQG